MAASLAAGAGCASFKETLGLEPKVVVKAGEEAEEKVSPESAYHFLKAELFTQRAEFAKALEEYEAALEADPNSAYLGLKVAYAHLTLGDIPGTEKAALHVLTISPGNADAHFLLGKLYYQTGREEEAIARFKAATESEPQNLEMLLFYGLLLAENMHFDEAIPVLNHILELKPDVDIVHFSLGKIYATQKDWEKAEGYYLRTLEINPGFKAAYAELGQLYEVTKQPEKTVALYRSLLQRLDPENVELRTKLAEVLLSQDKVDEALSLYEELKKDDPLNPRVTARLGLLYYQQERFADAVAQFQLLLAGDPGNDPVRYYLALSYERLGKRDLARKTLAGIGPGSKVYVDAVHYLAYLDESEKKIEDAVTRLRAALEYHPESMRTLRLLADVLRRAHRPDEAIAVLKDAIQKSPKDEELYFSLGASYDEKNDYEKTIESMKKVLELNPNHANALNYIGYTWADRGENLSEAEQMIRRAMELEPGKGFITDSLGWVYFKQQRLKEALAIMEEAVRLEPEDPHVVDHLGQVYEAVGQLEKALASYEQASSLLKPMLEQDPSNALSRRLEKELGERLRRLRKKLGRS